MSHLSTRWARLATVAVLVAGSMPLVAARHAGVSAASTSHRHLALRRAEPGVNDTIATSPTTITLWFTESVKAAGTSVRLIAADEHALTLGAVTVDAAAKAPAVVPVSETLKPGAYVVQWKTMAEDGHPTSGKFSFVLRAAK